MARAGLDFWNCWRVRAVWWAMLFSWAPPPGGDGSKVARFGEGRNGEGDFFHNLT